jgi:hypothetical protein
MLRMGAYKSDYSFDDLHGKSVEFAIPNETRRDAWARGAFEVAASRDGSCEIRIVIAALDVARQEVLKKRALTPYAINRIARNPNPGFADYQLFADGGKPEQYWQGVNFSS